MTRTLDCEVSDQCQLYTCGHYYFHSGEECVFDR